MKAPAMVPRQHPILALWEKQQPQPQKRSPGTALPPRSPAMGRFTRDEAPQSRVMAKAVPC